MHCQEEESYNYLRLDYACSLKMNICGKAEEKGRHKVPSQSLSLAKQKHTLSTSNKRTIGKVHTSER